MQKDAKETISRPNTTTCTLHEHSWTPWASTPSLALPTFPESNPTSFHYPRTQHSSPLARRLALAAITQLITDPTARRPTGIYQQGEPRIRGWMTASSKRVMDHTDDVGGPMVNTKRIETWAASTHCCTDTSDQIRWMRAHARRAKKAEPPNRKPTPIRRSFSLINDLQSGLDPLTMPLLAVIEWPGRGHITLVDSSSTRDAAV